jgi:hypothetical protein
MKSVWNATLLGTASETSCRLNGKSSGVSPFGAGNSATVIGALSAPVCENRGYYHNNDDAPNKISGRAALIMIVVMPH